jgi:hypothetical protein
MDTAKGSSPPRQNIQVASVANGTPALYSDKVVAGLVLQFFGRTTIFPPVPGLGADAAEDCGDGEIGVSYTGTATAGPATGYCSVVTDSMMFGCSAD